ncbi:MAG: beta-ketoacyl synthase N-terminal-like domain-containing protein [bacterium]
MNIAGIGIVSARGRGVAALEHALEQGWVPPVEVEARGVACGKVSVYPVTADTLGDKVVLAKARRADRFIRMSVLAAADAVQDSGIGASLDKTRMGIILATALGPHVTTFSFLDGILDFGDAAVSPTAFSHSVHNAAASYIAMTLEVRGPTLTVTHFDFAFHQAVLLAQTWLNDGRCDSVLVGAVDELGAVMQSVCGQMLKPAADGRIKPFAFSTTPESVPGEGAAFFLMTRDTAGVGYGLLEVIEDLPVPSSGGSLQILDACGMARDESAYLAAVMPGISVAAYAPLFGSLLIGSALNAAAAALMMKKQKIYVSPVQENPHGLMICQETKPAPLRDVYCTRLDCVGRRLTLHLGSASLLE